MVNAIVTIPPYAEFIREVAKHPIVSGLRINTVMPVSEKEGLENMLKRVSGIAQHYKKDLWIDLKGKQLRVKNFGVPPFTEIELTHNISVDTPVTAYFSNGLESAKILEAYGNKLIMESSPKRVVGPGESINIPHPSLKIEGILTQTDKDYITTASKLGIHNYMMSFVEGKEDLDAVYELDKEANLISKIESVKGMDYVQNSWKKDSRLMAARGDMYIELPKPHHVIQAMEDILKADPSAIVASRIFSSLSESPYPSSADIGDADNLMRMGYKTLMFGDEICQERKSIISGLNLLYEMAKNYR